jgi:hypothetical protein
MFRTVLARRSRSAQHDVDSVKICVRDRQANGKSPTDSADHHAVSHTTTMSLRSAFRGHEEVGADVGGVEVLRSDLADDVVIEPALDLERSLLFDPGRQEGDGVE